MSEEDFSLIESAEEVLIPNDRSIEDQISNNYYIEEYLSLFHAKGAVGAMRRTALQSGLRSCRFRSLCWRVFLECLPESTDERVAKVNEYRNKYESIRLKYNRDPRMAANGRGDHCPTRRTEDNPLSQETTSQWNQYFTDSELRSRITQDVIRTFPEIDFFQLPTIQEVMVNILFHYAREYPSIDYKQGMHELLAPLLFVIHCDHQTFLHAEEIGLIEEEIKVLMDPKYIEGDTYYLFCSVMERVESWYDNHSIQTKVLIK
ncbi:unnamed protein product [Oppiella nova]|uniref:Rab-GAP TBC domain-containing protein n=1 Tax=Oppiella nova TaxID=334625 RepID=A0A7R9QPN3_9ACAR|nr:unnamed protein product [Oppiella nova]CAG2169765.1 unnamed protein product [Oppiella nova]